jgi:hypothetical protein
MGGPWQEISDCQRTCRVMNVIGVHDVRVMVRAMVIDIVSNIGCRDFRSESGIESRLSCQVGDR